MRALERLVEGLLHLGEVVRLLVVSDRLRVVRRVLAEHLFEGAIRFLEIALRAQRFDERRVCGRGDDFGGTVMEDAARHRDRLAIQVEVGAEERVRHQDLDVLRIGHGSAAVVIERLAVVPRRDELLGLGELLRGRTFEGDMTGDPFVNVDRLLVLHLVRIELQRLLEALDRLAVPVAVEVAEAEVVDRLLVVGIELQRALERTDRALQLAFFIKNRPEKEERLRDRLELDRLLEELLCAEELPLASVNCAEGKVREERLLGNLDRAA